MEIKHVFQRIYLELEGFRLFAEHSALHFASTTRNSKEL